MQAGTPPDPVLSYGYFSTPFLDGSGPSRSRWGLSQTLPWFGKLSLREKQTALEADALEIGLESTRLKVIGQVKDAFYEYAYLGQAIAIARENRELLQFLEGIAQARYAAGLSPYAQTLQIQIELGRLEDRLRSLEDLRAPFLARLNTAMSRPPAEPLPLPGEVPVMIADMSDQAIMEGILSFNPEIASLETGARAAQTGVELARRNFYPDITLGLEMNQVGDTPFGDTRDEADAPVIGTVSINLPVWRESRRAGVREARFQERSIQERIVAARDRLYADMQLALYRYRDAGRKIDLFRDTLVPKAQQALGASLQAFQTGTQSALDLIEAERMLLEFQLSYLRALADQGRAMAEMEILMGREIPCRVHPVRLSMPEPQPIGQETQP